MYWNNIVIHNTVAMNITIAADKVINTYNNLSHVQYGLKHLDIWVWNCIEFEMENV